VGALIIKDIGIGEVDGGVGVVDVCHVVGVAWVTAAELHDGIATAAAADDGAIAGDPP
jgi:hypothetical protein